MEKTWRITVIAMPILPKFLYCQCFLLYGSKLKNLPIKYFKILGHQGLIMAVDVDAITVWLNATSIKH